MWVSVPRSFCRVCGLGVAFACAVTRSAKLLQSFKGFRGFKGFKGLKGFRGFEGFKGWQTAGLDAHKKPLMWPWGSFCLANGRVGRPEEAIDVAFGCPLLRKTSSTPAVVSGAAPALAKAGVGGHACAHAHTFIVSWFVFNHTFIDIQHRRVYQCIYIYMYICIDV